MPKRKTASVQIAQRKASFSDLTERGLEVTIPPGQQIPQSVSNAGSSSPCPPTRPLRYERRASLPSTFHEALHPLLPPPPPPMSISSRKILQLTGYDHKYERKRPAHVSFQDIETIEDADEDECMDEDDGENSEGTSGSLYSQPAARALNTTIPSVGGREVFSPTSSSPSEKSPQPLASNPSGKAVTSLKGKRKKKTWFVEPESNAGSSTKPGYEHDLGNPYGNDISGFDLELVPEPLAVRSRQKRVEGLHLEKKALFSGARDSMEWEDQEPTDPSSNKQTASSDSPTTPMSPHSESKRKHTFANAKHPLKSPFPFYSNNDFSLSSEEVGEKSQRRFSKVIRRFSGPSKTSPITQNIILNSERSAAGPDTPFPKSAGRSFLPSPTSDKLHHANEHLMSVYEKARRGLRLKTYDQKRRESLKKKIVVLGVPDQSPDGRVSEWL